MDRLDVFIFSGRGIYLLWKKALYFNISFKEPGNNWNNQNISVSCLLGSKA